jgi:hypothetical protein
MTKKQGNDSGYVGAAFRAVEHVLGELRGAVNEIREERDKAKKEGKKGNYALTEANRFLDLSEGDIERRPDYAVTRTIARKVGREYAETLRRLGVVLRAKSKLEEQIEEAAKETKREEFAEKRIAELNKSPYSELEKARQAGEGSDVYNTLIESTQYEGKPTRATYWAADQIREKDAVEALRAKIQAETAKVRSYKDSPKKDNKKDENGDKKEEKGNAGKKSKPARKRR